MNMTLPPFTPTGLAPYALLFGLGLYLLAARLSRRLPRPSGDLAYFWIFLLLSLIADRISWPLAVWLTALVAFRVLREYLSLLDLRPEDHWGQLGAYLMIPFMFALVQIDWYGFFIVSIPVYAFIVIPFLIAAAGQPRGSLWSIGALDFGLFFCVYGLGHLIYLVYFSRRLFLLLLLTILICNLVNRLAARRNPLFRLVLSAISATALVLGLRGWSGLPTDVSVLIGLLVPILVRMGDITLAILQTDLGMDAADLEPGRGRVLDALKSYLFTTPIVFHVLRWLMHFGDELIDHGY